LPASAMFILGGGVVAFPGIQVRACEVSGFRFLTYEGIMKSESDVCKDEKSEVSAKFDIVRSESGGCCLCLKNDHDLYVVREIESGRLATVCSCCILVNMEDYLIDNTRPWPILNDTDNARDDTPNS